MLTKNRKTFFIILIFVLIIFIRNIAFWSKEQTFIFGDTAIYALYLTALSKNLFSIFSLSNNFYFWNQNYLSVGLPTLSIIDLGYLYPPNILIAFIARLFGNSLLVFPLLTLSAYLHLAFGGYFVQKILRTYWNLDDYASLIGALLWIYIGFNVEYAAATSVLFSASYLPVCFYLNLRYRESGNMKHFFLFYIFLALSFLVGYPMPAIITFIISVTYNMFVMLNNFDRKRFLDILLGYVKGFFLITLPLISPLYFSSILNFPQSVRGGVLSLEGFVSNPAYFSNLMESLLPLNTPFNATSATNIVHIYISFVVVIILLQAKGKMQNFSDKRNLMLLVLGIVGTIMALGGITSIPTLIYLSVPVISFFRRLAIFSLIPGFALCILVPQYIKNAFSQKEISKPLASGIKILVLLLLLTQVQRILYSNSAVPLNYKALLQSLSIITVVGIVTITALMSYNYNPKFAKALLVFAILIEAGTTVAGKVYLNAKINPMVMFAPDDLTIQLNQLSRPGERVNMLNTHHSYSTDHLGIEQTAGYVALASEYGVRINDALTAGDINYNTKNLMSILGVRYVVKKTALENPDLKLIGQIPQNPERPNAYSFDYNSLSWFPDPVNSQYYVYENPTALPRLYLATKIIKTSEQSKYLLRNIEKLNDTREVLVKYTEVETQNISGKGTVEIQEYKRNYIRAAVKSDSPTFLANSTGYYPGWGVKVNGEWQKPIQTNWFMMGVFLPKGENKVEFTYTPYGVILGIVYIIGSSLVWFAYAKPKTRDSHLTLINELQ